MDNKSGYRNPPYAHRFKEGFSGNPKGRPRNTQKSAQDLMLKILHDAIIVQEGGAKKQITKMEAILKRLVNAALNGDKAAIKLLYPELFRLTEKYLEQPDERPYVVIIDDI